MARQSNADLLQKYRDRINATKKWRRDENYDDAWRRFVDLYRGRHYEYLTEEDRLLVNICFSTINVIAPSIAVNYPKITVNSRRPEDAPRAIVTEAIINYWWRHYELRPEFRRAVKDFLIIGHGWLKCGYRYVEEGDEGVSEKSEAEAPNIEIAEESSNAVEPTVVVVEDRPFVERVSPFDVFVDPDATSMQDIQWIAQRVRRTLKDVRSDKRYDAQARRECAPSSWGRISDEYVFHREVYDKDAQYVEVWEYYDLRKRTLSVFTEGGDRFLIPPRPMPYAFGHPFVMIRNHDIPDEFYPIGELEAIEPLQRELNETRTQMMNHRKRFARKYLYKEAAFDAQGRSLLASEADNVMVPVQSDDNLNNVIAPLPATITPPEFYNQSALISSDIETISGVSEYMRGQMPEMKRTATEASIIADAANARAADKLAVIEGAIAYVAQRLVQLAQQFLDTEQVARVTGKNGEPVWVTFDADYISGEFDFEVEAGSTAPNNESFRRMQALQMVDAMAPFASMGVVNMPKLAAHVLQFGFGVKNPESFLMQQAPPQPEAPQPEGGMPPEMGGMPPEMPPMDMPMAPPMPPEMGAQGGYMDELPPDVLQMLDMGGV
jgi:hypothetical protein